MSELTKKVTPDDPSLSDLLDLFKKDVLLSINCHHIATITSFNKENQTVEATVNYKRTRFDFNSETRSYDSSTFSFPLVVECPVIILSGGDSSLTFPIKAGDECVLLFNDRDIDNWFAGSNDSPVSTQALHSFSDAMALIGVRSSARLLSDYDDERAVLKNGDAMVGVGSEKVKISNAATSLLVVINGLIDVLSTGFSGPTPSPGNPLSPSAVSALNAYKTTVEGLLE